MRVGVIQMNSGDDIRANVRRAEQLIREAAKDSELIVLPECCLFRGHPNVLPTISTRMKPNTLQISKLAQELKIHILLGSVPEPAGVRGKCYNTTYLFQPDGIVPARYKKLHLFRNVQPDGKKIDESRYYRAGNRIASCQVGEFTFGFSICYDLRFPELYRVLASDSGANAFFIPSNFTQSTGEAHWHTLCRARAIENLSWVIAPAQCGEDPGLHIQTYGHSLVVSPWGEVIMDLGDQECIGSVEITMDEVKQARAKLPALTDIRKDVMKIEQRDRREEAVAAKKPGHRPLVPAHDPKWM